MEYDYQRYEQVIIELLKASWRDPDDLEIGRDISDQPEVKIIFDGYGDLEIDNGVDEYEYKEGGNTKMESYAIFIHKNAEAEGFEFPEHDMSPWCLIHRPSEEVCIHAWYEVDKDDWTINSLEETSEHDMPNCEVIEILETLNTRYFSFDIDELEVRDEEQPSPAWPFPTKD